MSTTLPTLAEMKAACWYYSAELEDGFLARGIYSNNLPFLPRLMQRQVGLTDCDCLDIGPAEGILPILAAKSGARQVVCAEHSPSIFERKLRYLAALHGTDIALEYIGRAQNVGSLCATYRDGFDFINLSGVLYHVTSPIDTIGASRSLLRRDGLMIISTPVVVAEDCFMEFNDKGRLQNDQNTYWYTSLGMLDYMLRLLCQKPIEVRYLGNEEDRCKIQPDAWYGTVSVLCQSTAAPVAEPDDQWIGRSSREGWELEGYQIRPKTDRSRAELRSLSGPLEMVDETGAVNLYRTVLRRGSEPPPRSPADTRILARADES